MRVLEFTSTMGVAGTEKAACRWAVGLKQRGHSVAAISLADGPRTAELRNAGIDYAVAPRDAADIAEFINKFRPDAIHAHLPGFPSSLDVLFEALENLGRKVPVVQTNIFGRMDNPRENRFISFRLFIGWSCCVLAARRAFQRLDRKFFQRASVAANPLDPDDGPPGSDVQAFRERLGIKPSEVVLGQFCRPDPIRWDETPLAAFREAQGRLGNLKYLLREPPAEVAASLKRSPDADRFIILPVTSDPVELRMTQASLDAVLHYSKVGESFSYAIAELMNLGKPAIVNIDPSQNLGSLEQVRHGECGFAITYVGSMAQAIVKLCSNSALRQQMGESARAHIRRLVDPEKSLDRLENGLRAAVEDRDNPLADEDVQIAKAAATYLDANKFGQTFYEKLRLRPFYYRVRFHEWRHMMKMRLQAKHAGN